MEITPLPKSSIQEPTLCRTAKRNKKMQNSRCKNDGYPTHQTSGVLSRRFVIQLYPEVPKVLLDSSLCLCVPNTTMGALGHHLCQMLSTERPSFGLQLTCARSPRASETVRSSTARQGGPRSLRTLSGLSENLGSGPTQDASDPQTLPQDKTSCSKRPSRNFQGGFSGELCGLHDVISS